MWMYLFKSETTKEDLCGFALNPDGTVNLLVIGRPCLPPEPLSLLLVFTVCCSHTVAVEKQKTRQQWFSGDLLHLPQILQTYLAFLWHKTTKVSLGYSR